MRIVLTNDDGIDAPGLAALYEAIQGLGEIHVVAPATVQSAVGHAVTFHKAIRVTERQGGERHPEHPWGMDDAPEEAVASERAAERQQLCSVPGLAVEGRPADCVKLALTHLVPKPVDLVISGMNAGANIGVNVIYSGTVAAAREASFVGVPSIAVSLHIGEWEKIRWRDAGRFARKAIDLAMTFPRDDHAVVNINVPMLDERDKPEGVKILPLSTSPLSDHYRKIDNADGSSSYRIDESMTFRESQIGTDVHALFEGYTTITPLHFDMTHGPQMKAFELHTQNNGVRS